MMSLLIMSVALGGLAAASFCAGAHFATREPDDKEDTGPWWF